MPGRRRSLPGPPGSPPLLSRSCPRPPGHRERGAAAPGRGPGCALTGRRYALAALAPARAYAFMLVLSAFIELQVPERNSSRRTWTLEYRVNTTLSLASVSMKTVAFITVLVLRISSDNF